MYFDIALVLLILQLSPSAPFSLTRITTNQELPAELLLVGGVQEQKDKVRLMGVFYNTLCIFPPYSSIN